MRPWNPQRYRAAGEKEGIDDAVLDAAIAAIERIQAVNAALPPLLTLMHLSKETGISYRFLRRVVGRRVDPYSSFALRKRTPGLRRTRTIHIPDDVVLKLQRWISQAILKQVRPHKASFGYHPGSSPEFAARQHLNARWLVKIDLADFFDNIREPAVYDVFRSLGYSDLLSFELARIVTRAELATEKAGDTETHAIPFYATNSNGFLPQGAPTSPMMSNLVMRSADGVLMDLAKRYGYRYSRYADDLVFSCATKSTRRKAQQLQIEAIDILRECGFTPNQRKCKIVAPGGRKMVLGLHVDGPKLRLPQSFKDNIRLHLYYLSSADHGPAAHASKRRSSIASLYAHVHGLISWSKAIEPRFYQNAKAQFNAVNWPREVVGMVQERWNG